KILSLMEIRNDIHQKEWEEFINQVKPSTFLHTWEWGEFEKNMGRNIFRFGIYDDGQLLTVALFSKIKARRGTFLLCPHGPVIRAEMESKLNEILAILTKEVKEVAKKEKCNFVRVSTIMSDTPEHR